MTSVKIRLRRSTVQGQAGRLFIQIIHNREIKQINTPVKVFNSEWDDKKQKILLDIRNKDRLQELISIESSLIKSVEKIEAIIRVLELQSSFVTADIVEHYNRLSDQHMLTAFIAQCADELRLLGKHNTAYKYDVTLRRFLSFRGGLDIALDELNSFEIRQFEKHLKSSGITMNTVSFYMRILRAVYNKASLLGLVPECNLFRDVYTGIAKTEKRAVDRHIIAELKVMELATDLAFSRDLFLFSFYTRGMSFIDIAMLRKCNCRGGTIRYKRRKTGQILSVHMERCMATIINRYAKYCSTADNLLPITHYDGLSINYSTTIQSHNKRLKTISVMLGIDPPLTSYVARHTWASEARKRGVNISVISESLGHTSDKTTQIYLSSLGQDLIDDANRIVINSSSMRFR